MYTLLLASWMCLPLAPLNPLEQDTVAAVNLSLTVGLSAPNGIISAGPGFAIKWEMRPVHPVIVRGTGEYDFSRFSSTVFPNDDNNGITTKGALHSVTFGADCLYYHGTHKLTGYLGFGLIYSFHYYATDLSASQAMLQAFGVNHVGIAKGPGYRIMLGLRFNKTYSLEIGVSEERPSVTFTRPVDALTYAENDAQTKLSTFRITIGRIFTLKKI